MKTSQKVNEEQIVEKSPSKKKISKKLLLILISSFVSLICILFVVWFFFLRDGERENILTDTGIEEVEIDNGLKNIPGDVRECYEESLGMSVFQGLQMNDRVPTEDELIIIGVCNEELGWEGEAGGSPGAELPEGPVVQEALCLDSDEYEYTYIGEIITQESTGINEGVIADSSAIILSDGRVRIYFGWTEGVMSVVSTSVLEEPYTDIEFEIEEGLRVSGRYGHPRIVKTDDRRFKLFVRLDAAIYSYISNDGLSFTQEDIILEGSEVGFDTISGVGVAKIDSQWKMYISNVLTDEKLSQPEGRPDLYIKSLTANTLSSDWVIDNNVRLGRDSGVVGFTPDDQDHVGQAEHPMVMVNSKDEVMLVFRGTDIVCFSKSDDGLTFEQPILISNEKEDGESFAGGDPDMIELEPGVYLITGTRGGPTLEGHIRMGILREK